MLQIYDKKSPLTMPTGITKTAQELKDSGEYDLLFATTCVIDVMDGIFCSYTPFEIMKTQYGILEEDPEKALEQILAIKENRVIAATNVESEVRKLQEQLEETQKIQQSQDQAIMELAIMMAGEDVM